MSSSFGRRALANYVQTGVTAAVPFVTLPLYTRTLGPDQMSAMTFATVIGGLLSTTEAGLSQALCADFARLSGEELKARDLFHTVQQTYGRAGLVVLVGATAGLALYFQTSAQGSAASRFDLVMAALIAVQVCASLVSSPARSFLLGTSQHERLAVITVASTCLRHIPAILVARATGEVRIVLGVHAVGAVGEACSRVWAAGGLTRKRPFANSREAVNSLIRGAKLSAALVLGAVATSLDRLAAGRILAPDAFAYVGIATSLAYAPTIAVTPYLQTVQPTIFECRSFPERTWPVLRKVFLVCTAYAIGVFAAATLVGESLVTVWIGSATSGNRIYEPLMSLLVATCLNLVSMAGYTQAISENAQRSLLLSNAGALMCALVFSGPCYRLFGSSAAGIVPSVMNGLVILSTSNLLMSASVRARAS